MPIVTLAEVLQPALKQGYAVAGLVCLGWEDMCAFTRAAEQENVPVILQAGPGCREHTPLPVLGAMFRTLGEAATVPVVAHLDHGYSIEECREAIDCGFTSVMFDGSRTPLQQNIDETSAVVELAHAADISCEGEIGFVGYAEGESSAGTDPAEAAEFAQATGIDAMAISVGNVHLQQTESAGLDVEKVRAIEAISHMPLVIHGGSGVPALQRRELAKTTSICKFNVGTELRMAFGNALRQSVAADETRFDRNAILKDTIDPVLEATRKVLQSMR
jgi:fructose-bisphosphate aldolase class II